jgi:hypothetical protein
MVPIPPVIALTLGVLGAGFVVRHIVREWQRAKDIERGAKAPVPSANDSSVPTLHRDSDGVYRP